MSVSVVISPGVCLFCLEFLVYFNCVLDIVLETLCVGTI